MRLLLLFAVCAALMVACAAPPAPAAQSPAEGPARSQAAANSNTATAAPLASPTPGLPPTGDPGLSRASSRGSARGDEGNEGAGPTDQPAAALPASPTTAPSATAALLLKPSPEPLATAAPGAEPTAASPAAAKPAAAAAPKPTAAPEPPARALRAGEPARIVIPAIGVDFPIVSVGLDAQNIPIVPDHDVGWYNLSARPGDGDNVVLWGHVLRFTNAPNRPAPFARVKQLKPGAQVVLYDRKGTPHRYRVTRHVRVTPDQVEYILPQGREMVTMVSCIGDKIISAGEVVDMSHRLVTIAEPAG
jgi:LPXTG-site transpeptidase (sortase) family protein